MIQRSLLSLLLWFMVFSLPASAQKTKPANTIETADELYNTGKIDEAGRQYELMLAGDPKLCHVRAGLMRVRLRQQRIDDAFQLGKAGLAEPGFTAELLAEMGNVHFRRAEMGEAETAYLHAEQMNPRETRAYMGLTQLYDAFSLHRKAYDQLKTAHEIAPKDAEVQHAWFQMLPRKERLQAIKDYLASTHPDEETQTLWLKQYAEFLNTTVDNPAHTCRQINKADQTQTPLIPLQKDLNRMRGFGLSVKLNGHGLNLMLDTGASGITVGRRTAERAGLETISRISIAGVGDKGLQSGHIAVAKKIRIGNLEFEDCVVEVSDRSSIAGEDGLIGADVFSSYLVDLDGPNRMMRLSPLPQRPGETQVGASLEADANKDEPYVPHDRYIAPEMASWSKIFRFGHELLIPTRVNDRPPMLFMLDTGSLTNMISTAAARSTTKVSRDHLLTVEGLNGTVDKVFSADRIELQFGYLKQENLDILTLDLSNLSKLTGTEVSGMLGFSMVRLLDVKIDYRDGLVDFSYVPKPSFLR